MSQAELPQRPFVVANPRSGRGKGERAAQLAVRRLAGRGCRPELLRTEHGGHAVELAAAAVRAGADLLLVVGGDGTVRDVVEGLDGAQVPVGLVPGGTGNDLSRTLGLPRDLEAALDVALGASERRLDVWRWNGTPFVNVAGVGLDAAVGAEVNRRFRGVSGALAYVAALGSVLPRFKPLSLRLEWTEGEEGPGGEWQGRAWLAAFGNARCYGGGMRIAPLAEPDDGLLDLVIVGDVSRAELLANLPGLFFGTHVRNPRVHSFRASSVRVEAAPQDATLDGELIGGTPATIERAPGSIRIRVPAPADSARAAR